jgi:hypothetical protein
MVAFVLDLMPVSSLRQTPRFAALTKLGGALLTPPVAPPASA